MSRTIQIQRPPQEVAANIGDITSQLARMENVFDGVNYRTSNAMPPSGEIVAANASLFQQAYFNQPLTDYAVGWRDPSPIDADLEFYAPECPTPRRFTYGVFTHIEEFYVDLTDDLRPLRGDFKTVEYTSDKVEGKTDNHGLRLVIDLDEEQETPDWQMRAVDQLMRRRKRNSLVRAFGLLSAAAVNTDVVWDVNADPDASVNDLLLATANAVGFRANRAGYGDTCWSYRFKSLRGNANAAKWATAGMTPAQVGSLLGLQGVNVSQERYAASMTALQEMVGNLLVLFYAQSGVSRMDPSNIKRFVSNCDSGQRYATYVRQISTKLWEVVVECYERTTITSTLGIQQYTVSDS